MDLIVVLIVLLILAWGTGAFVVHIGGGLIHLLLVIALIIFLLRMISGRRLE